MEWLAGILILIGATLVLLAAVGVLHMPDLFTRMQAATKAATLGLGCLLAGTAIQMADFSSLVRAIGIGAFVMLTSPVSTHVIARAAYLTRVPMWAGTVVDEWRAGTSSEQDESTGQTPV
jgi:multicomponent Na+:H+ antiporter subunit G